MDCSFYTADAAGNGKGTLPRGTLPRDKLSVDEDALMSVISHDGTEDDSNHIS